MMKDSSAPRETDPIVTDIPRFTSMAEPVGAHAATAGARFRVPALNLILFGLTLLTTTAAGADTAGADLSLSHPLTSLANLPAGFSFSIPLMLILLSHEMGHYLTSRRNGVDASLPYFIPALLPPSIAIVGTFGAFIRMRSLPRSRRAMFDIGAAGPWAGFVVALVAIVIGLEWSQVTPLDASRGGLDLGNSIVFWTVARWILGVDPDTVSVNLHPTAFAGWIGLLITALNLLPVGQLDGGHVVYSLFGPRRHRLVSRLVLLGCLLIPAVSHFLRIDYWPGWIFWFFLLLLLGLGHPSTMDVNTPLTGGRRMAAWATVLLFVVTFTPVPFSFTAPKDIPPPGQGPSYSVMYRLPVGDSPRQPGSASQRHSFGRVTRRDLLSR